MSYNKILDNDIKQIKRELNHLIEKTKSQFALTYEALSLNDMVLFQKVIDGDSAINEVQDKYVKQALWKIAKQHMVASDLRLAVGGIIIARDIERIADIAKHICEYAIKHKPAPVDISYISKLFDIINSMLNITSQIIENYNEDLKEQLLKMELEVTKTFSTLHKELAEKTNNLKNSQEIRGNFRIIRQLKDIERIAEYLIGVQETVYFIKNGKFVDTERPIIQEEIIKTEKK
ncbi:phosphate signaling complex protein PhoU [Spiroplasma endosymbiont of Crioceris asparagi]|uniref:phosphate signaling complex protein PhoU n=1 Tax=Spiroplasma endosymbiont of Crioceris asparagi TaxID=3066286 RepID=UPI0030CFEDED